MKKSIIALLLLLSLSGCANLMGSDHLLVTMAAHGCDIKKYTEQTSTGMKSVECK